MLTKNVKKLSLSKTTLRTLADRQLDTVAGGGLPNTKGLSCVAGNTCTCV